MTSWARLFVHRSEQGQSAGLFLPAHYHLPMHINSRVQRHPSHALCQDQAYSICKKIQIMQLKLCRICSTDLANPNYAAQDITLGAVIQA